VRVKTSTRSSFGGRRLRAELLPPFGCSGRSPVVSLLPPFALLFEAEPFADGLAVAPPIVPSPPEDIEGDSALRLRSEASEQPVPLREASNITAYESSDPDRKRGMSAS
jgi:hypothetical protein